jgi:hypothetical protein
MAAISKTTANKRLITRTLASSVETRGASLGAELTEILFDGHPPDPLTMEEVIEALITLVQSDYNLLAETDRRLATEKGQDDKKRTLRDWHIARVRQRIISTRRRLEGCFGPDGIDAAGLIGRTPESVDALIIYGRNIQEQLAEGLTDYTTLLGIERPDLAGMATRLGEDLDHLEASVEAVGVDKRETQQAQVQNVRAKEAWSDHYSPVAAILENFYRLADMNAHAERVRPTSRRRAGLPEAADLEDVPADPVGEPT